LDLDDVVAGLSFLSFFAFKPVLLLLALVLPVLLAPAPAPNAGLYRPRSPLLVRPLLLGVGVLGEKEATTTTADDPNTLLLVVLTNTVTRKTSDRDTVRPRRWR
jgi:hypothetical protein